MVERKRSIRGRRIRNAHAVIRNKELTPREKRGEVRRLTRRYEGIQGIKEERPDVPIPTEIIVQMRKDRSLRKLIRWKMDHETKAAGIPKPFTEMDVQRILDFHNSIQSIIDSTPALRQKMEIYTLAMAIHDYVKTRKTVDEMQLPLGFEIVASGMMSPHFQKNKAEMRQAIQEDLEGARMHSPIVKHLQSFHATGFFRRIWRDEKQLRRLSNQQLLLENELERGWTWGSVIPGLVALAQSEILIPSEQALNRIRNRDPSFDQRSPLAHERIVQEHVTNQLGKDLAADLGKWVKIQIHTLGKRRGMTKEGEVRLKMFEWIQSSLKNPENVRFLGRKALEWYSTRRG
ncbi:MAG: hypothetical protein AABW68_00855 [archaeon]